MSSIYSSLDSAKNEFRILQLRSIAVTVAPAALVDSNPDFLCTEVSIQCNLYTACHGDRPRYEALSYTWGDVVSSTPITVNGEEVLVTENLLAALQRFRKEYADVYLWVDALCINQLDNSEKAEQVKRMGDIYRNAAKTLIWLGPEYDDSHNVISQLVNIGHIAFKNATLTDDLMKAVVEGGDTHQLLIDFEAQWLEIFSEYLRDLPMALKFLNGCSLLLSRPYWSRVWIIQEFVVSPNVFLFCGRDEISYGVWQPACVAIQSLQSSLVAIIWEARGREPTLGYVTYVRELVESNTYTTTIYALISTRSIYQAGLDQRKSLFSAICSSQIPHKFNAKDDRDLVFALLGLTSDTVDTKLLPDYDESTTCQEVYTSAARFMVYQGDIDVISLAQHQSNVYSGGLPSWVPDWRVPTYQPFCETPISSCFQVSGSAPFSLTIDHDYLPKNQVKLLGYLLSPVELLGTQTWCPPYGDDIKTICLNRESYLETIMTLCQKSDQKLMHPNKLQDPYPHPNDRASAEMNIPVSGMELHGKNVTPRHANNPMDDHTVFEKGFLGAMEATRLKDRGPYSDETHRYFYTMKFQSDRRGILLDNGLVGTGPTAVEVGDAVVIFKGAKFPYVLRRKEEDDLLH